MTLEDITTISLAKSQHLCIFAVKEHVFSGVRRF